MPYECIKGTSQEVTDRLNGAISFGVIPKEGLKVGALTLIFTTPSETVTFSGSAGDMRTPAEILAQIKAVLTTARVTYRTATTAGGRGVGPGESAQTLVIEDDGGVALGSAGTANALFGVKAGKTIDGGAPIPAARVVSFGPENLTNQFFALIAPES